MLRKRIHDDTAMGPSGVLPAASVHSKRARLDARTAARLAAAVIDLSRDSPFAFIDLRTPATPLFASPRSGLASGLAASGLVSSPALPASAFSWAAEGPAPASSASPASPPPPSAAALAPPSPDAPILDSPGPVWSARLDSLKARMPAVYGAFVRQMATARAERTLVSVAAAAAANANANAAAAAAAANATGPSGALAAANATGPSRALAALDPAAFDGSTAMSVGVAERYVARLPRWAECSESTEVLAYIYIERMRARDPGLAVRPRNVRRLFTVALLLAIKFNEERHYRMSDWARHCGIRLPELIALELRALELLEWRLAVPPAEFEAFLAVVSPLAPAAPEAVPEPAT
jgi:hypothetical protein